jgi:hypothetical protein
VVEYRKDGMDVFKSQDLEMIATTNNFPSSKEKEKNRDKRLFRKSNSLLLIYLYKQDESG